MLRRRRRRRRRQARRDQLNLLNNEAREKLSRTDSALLAAKAAHTSQGEQWSKREAVLRAAVMRLQTFVKELQRQVEEYVALLAAQLTIVFVFVTTSCCCVLVRWLLIFVCDCLRLVDALRACVYVHWCVSTINTGRARSSSHFQRLVKALQGTAQPRGPKEATLDRFRPPVRLP